MKLWCDFQACLRLGSETRAKNVFFWGPFTWAKNVGSICYCLAPPPGLRRAGLSHSFRVNKFREFETAFAFSLFVDIAEQVIDDFWGLTIADQAVELGMIQKYSVLTHLY